MPERHPHELRHARRARNNSILQRHRAWELRIEALELRLETNELRARIEARRAAARAATGQGS